MANKSWDHWPTDEELAKLVIDPETMTDADNHQYQALPHARGIKAICTCCERDFTEGGFMGFAPQGRELFRLLICPDHSMTHSLMDTEEEEVPAG